jgi:photosystem II stability/assembly factor-like uncharacterized protein
MFLPDARDGSIYAALSLGHFGPKLHRGSADGKTWQECAVPAYPIESAATADPTKPAAALELIWSLEAAGPDPGSLWAGTIPGGLFRSDDAGKTWQLNTPLWNQPKRKEWMGGGMDRPGIHSICVDPRDHNHVAVGVSCGGVWDTPDAGQTWVCKATGMRAAYMPPDRQYDPHIQDPHRVVQSPTDPRVMWAQHHNGIFHTTTGGDAWHEVFVEPSSFGFAVAVHPTQPQTAWFVPALSDEKRVPAEGRIVVTRTHDGGKSFQILDRGLPQANAYHIVFRHALDVDNSGQLLAFGSTTGSLWTSDDSGENWQCVSADLPPIYCVRFAPG